MASAILNDLWGGNLIPLSNRSLISLEQIEDEIIEERAIVIKEWHDRDKLNKHELMYAINCIEVDCKDQNKCQCMNIGNSKNNKHFEIPQLVDGLGFDAIEFIGSTDRSSPYDVYFDLGASNYHKYKRRNYKRPYVYIERTPNEHNKYDGWIFNAPFVKYISIIGIFKDPRQLKGYNCCDESEFLEMGSISNEIKKRILEKKIRLYRTLPPPTSQVTA